MTDEKWPVWKLALLLYPFSAGAVAINFFMALLLAQAVGISAISPQASVIWGLILGVPATWAAGKWARHLIDQADP